MTDAPPERLNRRKPFRVSDALARAHAAYFAPVPAERIAVVRILVGGFACWHLIRRVATVVRTLEMDPAGFAPIGVVSFLSEPLPAPAVVAVNALSLVFALTFTLGYRYRVTAPIFALLFLWVTSYRSSWGMIFHSENLLFWHIAVLANCRAELTLSFDARRAARRGNLREQSVRPDDRVMSGEGWALKLVMLVTALVYCLAGVAKLRGVGLDWLDGEVLRNHIAFNSVRKAELGTSYSAISGLVIAHAWAIAPLAWGSLLLELSGPFTLFSWRARQSWAIALFAFHWSIAWIMGIAFVYPMSGIAFAAFFRTERLIIVLQSFYQRLRERQRADPERPT